MVAPDTVPPQHSFATAPSPHYVIGAVLDRLAAEVGDEAVREMCRLFLRDLPGHVGSLRLAFSAGDAPGVARAAHAQASSARLLGATFLADLCAEIERKARSGLLDDEAAAALGMVAVVMAGTTAELQTVIGASPGE